MNFSIENVFATPIYFNMVENLETIQKEFYDIKEKINFSFPKKWGTTSEISDYEESHFNGNALIKYNLKTLMQQIDFNLKNYCDVLNYNKNEYAITSWFTRNIKGSYAHIHTHGPIDISGVFYFQTNMNDGDLFFQTPVPGADASLCFQNYVQRWVHKPKIGKMLLFPGWLSHGVTTNETDSERISLSFNITFKR